MRKHVCFPLVLFAILSLAAVKPAFAAQLSNTCYLPPEGLSAWWPGDGTTADLIAGRDAILHGEATTGPGLVNQAFILDGDGDFIEVLHDSALNLGTSDFTLHMWVLFNDTASEQVLIEKWIQRFSAGSDGWALTKLEGNVLRLAMPPGTDTETNVDSDLLTIPTDTWIHFAATRQAGEVTLFLNGQPVASGSNPESLDSTTSLKFGHRGSPTDTPGSEDESGFFLNGRIDEVQLYVGHSLPHETIQAIYNAGSLGQCRAPVTTPAPSDLPAPQSPSVQLLYPKLTGAFIELHAEPLRPGLWTRIQWQDAFGVWQDIEGWQGSFNEDGRVLWYVGEERLGEGPFRWLVNESQGGELLAVSESFSLPSHGGEMLRVEVSLPASVMVQAANPQTATESSQSGSPLENVALGKPVIVTTNGADEDYDNPGGGPADVTDGRLDYLPAGDAQDDGTVGYLNDDLDQEMVITVTIELQGSYDVSRIRYNMGHVQRAETWNADRMTTPFGTTPTNPGTPGNGVWTEHTGSATLSSVTIVLEKTRISYETDWLFIGEIEVYGAPK